MIPAFELAKAVHTLDRAATVIGDSDILHVVSKETFNHLGKLSDMQIRCCVKRMLLIGMDYSPSL
jgi:hypothetical protein